MATELGTLLFLAALGAVGILVRRAVLVYLKYHGARLIRCPETGKDEGVIVDAAGAAAQALTGHRAAPHLRTCTRWPERKDCGQECLRQVEAAPRDFIVERPPHGRRAAAG
jgi:hypothetical protein